MTNFEKLEEAMRKKREELIRENEITFWDILTSDYIGEEIDKYGSEWSKKEEMR